MTMTLTRSVVRTGYFGSDRCVFDAPPRVRGDAIVLKLARDDADHGEAGPSLADLYAPTPLRQGTLISDGEGRVIFATDNALALLELLDRSSADRRDIGVSTLPGLIRAAARVPAQRQNGRAVVVRVIVPDGLIVGTAEQLACAHGEARTPFETDGTCRLVTLSLHERASVRVERVLKAMGATRAQARVGTAVVLGKSKREIADDLGIKVSSVEDALRKLYAELGVHCQTELASRVWLHGA
jgi:DNA-binding CsgD family transcriptional regulator